MSTTQQRATRVIATMAGVSEEAVKPETSFVADLNMDSLDRVELTMSIEDEFGIEIPDEHAEPLATAQQLFDYLATRVTAEA